MNAVLELQKLAHDAEGKGQAAEATVTTWTVTIFLSTISVNNC
ncbi:class III lanthipeptide [Paenibacillus pinihumi]|nr:class III lanthipeptide [Paenibacillus pinihumi]